MKRKLLMILSLVAVNGALAFSASHVKAESVGGDPASGFFNCCQENTSHEGFCCLNCCWFTDNCDVNWECALN